MLSDDWRLDEELTSIQMQAVPLSALQQKVRDITDRLRLMINSTSDLDINHLLAEAIRHTTSYSLMPILDANNLDTRTKFYGYPLISSLKQAKAFLGHFLHCYIGTVHQEIRLIALRLLSVASTEEDLSVSEMELSVRLSALHQSLHDALRTYAKLVPMTYSPTLANQAHRFTDPLILDPQIPLSSTRMRNKQSSDSSTMHVTEERDVPSLTMTDYSLSITAMTRAPDLYDELEPRLGALDLIRVGEITRRTSVALERYVTTTHSQFHCDYPYLYTSISQLQNSLVVLGDSYSVLLDPLREATEFVSRSTKLVTSSVDKLIRFFAVTQRKPCDENCGLESLSYSAVISDIGIGLTSPVAILDTEGYERIAKLNPRYQTVSDSSDLRNDNGMTNELRLHYRNTYTVAARRVTDLISADNEAYKQANTKLMSYLNAPFHDATTTIDAERRKQEQCRRISASPLFLVDYKYKFIAGAGNSSVTQTNSTSAAGTSDDIFRVFTAAVNLTGERTASSTEPRKPMFMPITARTKSSSFLPGRGMPIFTHSLNMSVTDTRIKTGPGVVGTVPANMQLFNGKSLVTDEMLNYDLNLVKLSFLDVEDYGKMKQDNYDSLTGDIIATVNRYISARVKAHLSYITANLPANLLHLHYYMIYGKLIHIRARLFSHHNHLEYVRSRIDSDLHLKSLGYPFENENKPFDIKECGAFVRELLSKDNPAGSGTGRYGTLGFRRDDTLNERSSLKANDILAPDKSRVIFMEAIRQVSSVIERDILYAGSTLVEYLLSDAAENKSSPTKFEAEPLRVDRMIILLFLYEQELSLVEHKRQVVDQAMKCYFHSVSYADSVSWLQYVCGIINLRPSYDSQLLLATNDINNFTGCQALILRLQQISRFISEYISSVLDDEKKEAVVSGVHSRIERQVISTDKQSKLPAFKVEVVPHRDSGSQRRNSVGSRWGSSTFRNVTSKVGASQIRPRATSALASKASKHGDDDLGESSLVSVRSSLDILPRNEGPKRALLLSGHTDLSEDSTQKILDRDGLTENLLSEIVKDSFILTFPRYNGFSSPVYQSLAGTTVCGIYYSIGKLINLLCSLDKCAHLFTQKYLLSIKPVNYAIDLCSASVYEAAREELFFVARSRRTRGSLGTLPQHLLKQCRYGFYGLPHELLDCVETTTQAHNCLNILACKRHLALLTIQTTLAVQGLGSCFNELGRRLSKLSLGRGSWTNSCLEEMLPNLINFKVFESTEKQFRATDLRSQYIHDVCKETETEYDYSLCLLDFSKRDFTATFDSFQLPHDFDFELCLLDPLAGAAVRLLRDITPTLFKPELLFVNKQSNDLLEAALPDIILSDDSSDEEFIFVHRSKTAAEQSASKHTQRHLPDQHEPRQRALAKEGTPAIDLSYKSFHPYSHIPNFLSPSTSSDVTGALNGFSYYNTLFTITMDCRKDGYLEMSRVHPSSLPRNYQRELSTIVSLMTGDGREQMEPKLASVQDEFESNPHLYLDNVVGFMQRLVFVQACGLEFYSSVLRELIETVMIPLRNLNSACELKTRHTLMAQNVDVSAASAVLLLDNVPESTSFFITQQYAELNNNNTMTRGTIPLGKEPQESSLNSYTVNDCFLSFLILAAEYKYIWSNTTYIQARSTYAELQDKLASGVVGNLIMFERTRCVESVLLAHKDRLLTVKRSHLQTDPERGSLSSDATHSARSSSRGSVNTLEDPALPFYLCLDLRNAELITMALMICDYTRVHSLRSQLADVLNRLRVKHKEIYLCGNENIVRPQKIPNTADWNAFIDDSSSYSSAPVEQQKLEFLNEFSIVTGIQSFNVDIEQVLKRYFPDEAIKSKKVFSKTRGVRARHDVTDIYDILCLSPYLIDPLVHESISQLLFNHTSRHLSKLTVPQTIFPQLTIVPPASAVRFIASSRTASLSQALPLLSGLIHLYTSFLQYFDFSLVLQRLSCRLTMSEHEHYDEKTFDTQVHDLLLDDSSTGFIRRANGYINSIVQLTLNNDSGGALLDESELKHGYITRLQKDDDGDSVDTEGSTDSEPSSVPNVSQKCIQQLSASSVDGKEPLQSAIKLEDAKVMEILTDLDDKLDIQDNKADRSLIKKETKELINQLRLVSNQRALDFKIRGPRCRNNMVVFFARLMSIVMISVWRQYELTRRNEHLGTDLVRYDRGTSAQKKAHYRTDTIDFNKYAASQNVLCEIVQKPSEQPQVEEEYMSYSVKMLEGLSSKKVLDLQAMSVTPPEQSPNTSQSIAPSDELSDDEEDYTSFLPSVGNDILITSQAFVEVLKIVYVMRDFAFERIMGYALICLKNAYEQGDFISVEGMIETFEHVKRITGFDLSVVSPTQKVLDIILESLTPSGDGAGVPAIFEENTINERTATIMAQRNHASSTSPVEVIDEIGAPAHPEFTDQHFSTDPRSLEDDVMRTTDRVSLDLLEESIPEPRGVYVQDSSQQEMLQSLTKAGLKLNLRGLKTCKEDTSIFHTRLLNNTSSFASKLLRDRFSTLTFPSSIAFPVLDNLFNGMCTGYRFGPQLSCLHGYEPFGPKFTAHKPYSEQKGLISLPPISLQCSATGLGQHLMHMRLDIVPSDRCLVKDDACRRTSFTKPSGSKRSSTSINENSFTEVFGAAAYQSITTGQSLNEKKTGYADASVLHLHIFLGQLYEKYYSQIHGKREPSCFNRHAVFNYSDFFLQSEDISPLALYPGERVLGIESADEYSEICCLSRYAKSVVSRRYSDVFDPVARALNHELSHLSPLEPPEIRSVVVGRLQLFKLHCLASYIDSHALSTMCLTKHMHGDPFTSPASDPIQKDDDFVLALSYIPDYAETVLAYHTHPDVEPWLNSNRLYANIFCLVAHIYRHFLRQFAAELETFVENIRMYIPDDTTNSFIMRNRFFKNPAPIYPLIPGLYGLSPAEITLPYLPGDSLQSTRFLHKFFGRNMITVEALSNGIASSGENQHLVVITNYTLARMIDKFKSILFGEITQQVKMELHGSLMSSLGMRMNLLNLAMNNSDASVVLTKILTSISAAVSSQSASYLHGLQNKLSSLRMLNTNIIRETRLLPTTLCNIVTHVYSDALNMLFSRIIAEKEIAIDLNDDACAVARRTVTGERIKALLRLSQRVPSHTKFFLECAEKEKELAFYEEALMLETRFMRKSAAFNGIRRSFLERKIQDYSTLFEQEYIRLVGLHTVLVDTAKETEESLRLEMAQLTQQLQRLDEDSECLHTELQDRLSIVTKTKTKQDTDKMLVGMNTLTPIATIAEAMALPEQLKVDVERLQLNTQKAKQDVEALKAEVYTLKKQYIMDVTFSENRAKQLRNDQKLFQARRQTIINTANNMLRDNEQLTNDTEAAWIEAKETRKAEYWGLVNHLRTLRSKARDLERVYSQMQREVQRVRAEGEKLILGGLTPLTFKNN